MNACPDPRPTARFALLLALAMGAALSACSTRAPSSAAATPADAQAACAARGGVMQPLGRLQREQCVVPYADAGKACTTKSDCTGQCLATTGVDAGTAARGVCQRDASENFGCRQRIDGGVAQGTICVD